MATSQEKHELMETLKFTPITVTMRIQGYGGECYSGKVSREDYDFFKNNKYDLDEYANGWDDDWQDRVPVEHQIFPPGSAYECDGLFHASGAELSNLNSLTVENNETYETIWEISPGWSELEDVGATVEENFAMAARNIPNIDVLPVQGINVYDILRRDTLVLTKAAVEALEARFK